MNTGDGQQPNTAAEEYRTEERRLLDKFGIEGEPTSIDISMNNGRVHVLVAGDGPEVAMISPPGPGGLWVPLIAELDGFTVYAIDAPGFGLTDPVHYTKQNLRRLAVSFLGEVFEALGLGEPVLVANSIGGLWATWFALDSPDAVGALAYVGAPSLLLDTNPPVPERLLSIPPIGRLMMRLQPPSPKQVDQLFAMMNEDLTALPEIRELMLACETLPGFNTSLLDFLHATVNLAGTRPELRVTNEQLSGIGMPALLIWGEDEPAGPPATAERAAGALPSGERHVVPGGHIPWLSHPKSVAEVLIPFLEAQARQAPG